MVPALKVFMQVSVVKIRYIKTQYPSKSMSSPTVRLDKYSICFRLTKLNNKPGGKKCEYLNMQKR